MEAPQRFSPVPSYQGYKELATSPSAVALTGRYRYSGSSKGGGRRAALRRRLQHFDNIAAALAVAHTQRRGIAPLEGPPGGRPTRGKTMRGGAPPPSRRLALARGCSRGSMRSSCAEQLRSPWHRRQCRGRSAPRQALPGYTPTENKRRRHSKSSLRSIPGLKRGCDTADLRAAGTLLQALELNAGVR
jgi:hypothetical protein